MDQQKNTVDTKILRKQNEIIYKDPNDASHNSTSLYVAFHEILG